jgi:hypothetical protein
MRMVRVLIAGAGLYLTALAAQAGLILLGWTPGGV